MIKMKEWIAPTENGIPILGMPNVPQPLHGLAPRTIMHTNKWKLERTKCYMKADYICEICGKYTGAGKCDAHELYDVYYDKHYSKFVRLLCLCKECHQACHSGRNLALYIQGDKYTTKKYMLELAERTFKLVHQWNMYNIEKDPIKLCDTWLAWEAQPELTEDMTKLRDRYEIEFYQQPTNAWNKKSWSKWYLEYNDKKHPTPYESVKEWKEKYEK